MKLDKKVEKFTFWKKLVLKIRRTINSTYKKQKPHISRAPAYKGHIFRFP
jgi:hypothetical protein